MDDSLRAHPAGHATGSPAGPAKGHRLVRRALTLVIAACLLASCSAQDPSDSGTTPERVERAAKGSALSLGDAGAAGAARDRSRAPAQTPPEKTAEQPAPEKAVESLPAVPASRSKVALA